MSSRLPPAILGGLVTAPLVALAVLVLTARPGPPAATPATRPALPSVGIWRVVCPPDGNGWGPYSNPDACRGRLETAMRTCNRPLLSDGKTPNPDFVLIADMCRDAYNASYCRCEFQLVVARARNPTVDEVLYGGQP